MQETLAKTSDNYRFSAAVAGFGQLLRGGNHSTSADFESIIKMAEQAKGSDKNGYRGEFLQIVKLADALKVKATDKKVANNTVRYQK